MDNLTTNAALMGAAIAGLIGLITTLINAYFTYINQQQARRSEERRQLLDLCFKAAITDWQSAHELAKNSRTPVRIAPLDSYIIYMLNIGKLIESDQLSFAERQALVEESRQAFSAEKEKDQQTQE